MVEYIELKAAVELAMQYCPDDDGTCSKADKDIRELLDELEDLPAADVVPLVHAYWRDTGSGQECSACKEIQYGYDTGRHYCANCGAKMDGEKKENCNEVN